MRARIHSIETLSAVDGPDARMVVFLQGCPLRCKYCHNPDARPLLGGTETTVDQLFQKLMRYRSYFGEGRVTFSGGEPLVHARFLQKIIPMLQNEGFHVAIETGGGCFDEAVQECLCAADLVIFDLKHTSKEGYKELCGGDFEIAQKMMDFLRDKKKEFWVRQVIVTGYTDDEQSILRLKELSRGAQRVELLPYHTLGEQKYKKMGEIYPLQGLLPPTQQKMQSLNRLLKQK